MSGFLQKAEHGLLHGEAAEKSVGDAFSPDKDEAATRSASETGCVPLPSFAQVSSATRSLMPFRATDHVAQLQKRRKGGCKAVCLCVYHTYQVCADVACKEVS